MARNLRGLTQDQVHKLGGPSKPTQYRIETDPSYEPEGYTLDRLANALQVKRAWLEKNEGPMEEPDLSTFGGRLTLAMEEASYDAAAVAKALRGVKREATKDQILRWMADEEEPDDATKQDLSVVLAVPHKHLRVFLFGPPPPAPLDLAEREVPGLDLPRLILALEVVDEAVALAKVTLSPKGKAAMVGRAYLSLEKMGLEQREAVRDLLATALTLHGVS